LRPGYTISLELLEDTYPELEPIYKQHYSEMAKRLEGQGIFCSPYNPRNDAYIRASKAGGLLGFVLRFNGKAVGYSNIYLALDMHNQDLIAQEDTIYVLPEHRNGVGKELVRHVLRELKERGVKRLNVSAVTDLRVSKIWERMGFKHSAEQMTYIF
jgi:GNAT superfamily N-acetyltransferase